LLAYLNYKAMKVLLQRTTSARVEVDGEKIGEIGSGVVLLVGFCKNDNLIDFNSVVEKIGNLRIFSDEAGRLQYSCMEVEAEFLLVPQFTLCASTRRGRRPDFGEAMEPCKARENFLQFVTAFERFAQNRVSIGKFGANMQVHLVNNGPFTLNLEF
jgi:D-tyrosyl-tRNA(Tyr) deacylase